VRLFVITVDTEADCDREWRGKIPDSYTNLSLLRTQLAPICVEYGAVATLLLNGDIIERDDPSRICAEVSEAKSWELGVHLHGEFVEPDRSYPGPAGVVLSDFQCGYEDAIEYAKMVTITERFTQRFQYSPKSFRAGRFGAGPRTFEICARLGYEVDTSVVPGYRFHNGSAVADFTRFDCRPEKINTVAGKIWEFPVTVRPGIIGRSQRARDIAAASQGGAIKTLTARAKRMAYSVCEPLLRPTWLRPSYTSATDLRSVLKWLADGTREHVVANMMFHSSELLPGASPYTHSQADVDEFLFRISNALRTARELGFQFATLSGCARLLDSTIQAD
jgi:hypothetical protein